MNKIRERSSSYAGAITTLLSVVNMVVGFGFQAILAASLGVSQLSDSFQLAWAIVTFSTVTLFSLVPTLLVPRIQIVEENAIYAGSIWLPPAVGVVFSVIQVGIATGLTATDPALAAILLWSSPSAALAGLCGYPQAIAYVQKRFALAALGPIANGIGLLSVTLLTGPDLSPEELGGALTVGYAAQLVAITVPLIWNRPGLRWQTSISVRAFLGIAAFTLIAKAQPVAERLLSVTLAEGATTALGFGQKIAQGLLLVAAFGLALTATATLSRHIVAGEFSRAAGVLTRTLAGTILLACVTIAGAIPLALPATVLLFERGSFTSTDSSYVADVVLVQLPWVFALATTGVLTSYLYVQRSYLRVVGASLLGIAATAVSSLLLASVNPSFAVAIGSTVGALVTLVWAAVLVSKSPIRSHLRTELALYKRVFAGAAGIVLVSLAVYVVCRAIFGQFAVQTALLPLIAILFTAAIAAVSRGLRAELRMIAYAKI